jgi:hypothetical protein
LAAKKQQKTAPARQKLKSSAKGLNFGLPKFSTPPCCADFSTLFRASADLRLFEAIRGLAAKRTAPRAAGKKPVRVSGQIIATWLPVFLRRQG